MKPDDERTSKSRYQKGYTHVMPGVVAPTVATAEAAARNPSARILTLDSNER